MGFEIVLQGLWYLLRIIYYQLEAIFRFFIRPPRKDVSGEVVLITGAGSGIGQRLAVEFAKLGCTIVGWDISQDNLDDTEKVMREETGIVFHSYICDLSNRNAIYEVADKVKEDVGHVDILINNAGIVSGKTIMHCPDKLMQKTMEVNTCAHFWTIKAFLPHMLEQNHGHVVTVASAAGHFGSPGHIDYSASKFGAVGLSEALYNELLYHGKTGVHSTCICPFYINTGMFDGIRKSMIPIMEKNDAVLQMVDAILRNKAILMMPRIFYFFGALKALLPIKATYATGMITGIYASMDDFVGRKKED